MTSDHDHCFPHSFIHSLRSKWWSHVVSHKVAKIRYDQVRKWMRKRHEILHVRKWITHGAHQKDVAREPYHIVSKRIVDDRVMKHLFYVTFIFNKRLNKTLRFYLTLSIQSESCPVNSSLHYVQWATRLYTKCLWISSRNRAWSLGLPIMTTRNPKSFVLATLDHMRMKTALELSTW